MKEIDVPAIKLFEFTCDESLVTDTYNFIQNKKIAWKKQDQQYPELGWLEQVGTPFYYDPLYSWFEECLKEVSSKHFHDKKFAISDSWLIRTSLGEESLFHYHSASILSAVFYINTDDQSSNLSFYYDDPVVSASGGLFHDWTPNKKEFIIKPNNGKLVIFPSYLRHRVPRQRRPQHRLSLSFNAFFDGIVQDALTQHLEIKVKDVRTRYQEYLNSKT